MKTIRSLMDMSTLMQLPKSQRRIVFYSEGRANWPHLENVLKSFLAMDKNHVCYVSSGEDDPGLALNHPNLSVFKIDEGWIRNWFFANIDTDVMVMTMPDLHSFQVKRSKHPVHYVYIHHALVSCHMVYRPGAFDHFDTIFCAGPHHEREIRALEAQRQRPPKNLVQHGYGRLDAILNAAEKSAADKKHILIAPSWGPHGLIETIGDKVVEYLLSHQYQVTLRPHPQTVKFAKEKLGRIYREHCHHPCFTLETNMANQTSLHESALMISDWSGAALDYAFGLGKPVLFIDMPKKVNNPDYDKIGIAPFEETIRDKIGAIVPMDKIHTLKDHVEKILAETQWHEKIARWRSAYTYNLGKSGEVGARALMELLS